MANFKKKMKYLSGNILLLGVFIIALFSVKALSGQKNTAKHPPITQSSLDNRHFTFHAHTALPLQMRVRNLVSDYTVSVSGDTLRSDLPYFGRAYTAVIGETTSPLDFTSHDFTSKVTPHRKGGWNVVIHINDRSDLVYSFVIFSNGSASLTVTGGNRDTISFNGTANSRIE